jgi:hypothetical protein
MGVLLAMAYGVPGMGGEVAPTRQPRSTSTKTGEPAVAPASPASPASPAPDAALDMEARDHYLAGARALDAGRHQEAYPLLLEAWNLKKHFLIAVNLGIAELELGRYRDAAEHLAYFQREATGVGAYELRQASLMLQEARKHIGTVTVQVSEPGAEILVDGESVGTAPLGRELFLEPGERVIEARRAGFATAQAFLDLAEGSTRVVSLKPQALRAVGGDNAETPSPAGDPVVWPAVAAAGLALANIGLGVGFTTAANDRSAAARETGCRAGVSSPACARTATLLEEKDRFSNLAVVGYAAGGVAAAGAAALVIWPLRTTRKGQEAKLTPMASFNGGGLLVKGTF